MPHDPNAALFADPDDLGLEQLAVRVREECDALARLLPEATAVQWHSSPVPVPRESAETVSHSRVSDPTPSVALDERRLRLRAQIIASERVLREAAISARGVRIGLERALDAWSGGSGEDLR